jgi:hypothetical protein
MFCSSVLNHVGLSATAAALDVRTGSVWRIRLKQSLENGDCRTHAVRSETQAKGGSEDNDPTTGGLAGCDVIAALEFIWPDFG